jgi:hypothetical protein
MNKIITMNREHSDDFAGTKSDGIAGCSCRLSQALLQGSDCLEKKNNIRAYYGYVSSTTGTNMRHSDVDRCLHEVLRFCSQKTSDIHTLAVKLGRTYIGLAFHTVAYVRYNATVVRTVDGLYVLHSNINEGEINTNGLSFF